MESVRDFDGDWQFLCGAEDCVADGEPHHIGVGHLIQNDPAIEELASLKPGTFAERSAENKDWSISRLE